MSWGPLREDLSGSCSVAEGEPFYREKKEVGRATVHGFSLAESLPGKNVLASCGGPAVLSGQENSPFWSSNSI